MPAQLSTSQQCAARRTRRTFTKHQTPLRPIFTHGRPSGAAHSSNILVPCDDSITVLAPNTHARPLIEKKFTGFEVEDLTTAVAQSPDGATVVHALRSGRVDFIDASLAKVIRSLRPFRDRAVVSHVTFDASGTYVVLATADGQLRIHDVRTGDVTHVYRLREKILTAVAFHPVPEKNTLLLGLEDGGVMICNLGRKEKEARVWMKKHVGSVLGFSFANGGTIVVTVSSDKLLCIVPWGDVSKAKWVSTGERLLAVVPVAGKTAVVLTVGERGVVRKWDVQSGREDLESSVDLPFVANAVGNGGDEDADDDDRETPVLPTAMTTCGSEEIVVAMSDQTLLYIPLSKEASLLPVRDVVCGNLEEIYDLKVLETAGASTKDSSAVVREFAVASNASCLWIMRLTPSVPGEIPVTNTMDISKNMKAVGNNPISTKDIGGTWSSYTGLRGHSGIILSTDALTSAKGVGKTNLADAYLATSSRDKTARVWRRSRKSGKWVCMGLAEGHTDAIGAVAISPRAGAGQFFIVTGASDRTLKLWSLDQAQNAADKRERGKIQSEGMDICGEDGWKERVESIESEGGAVSKLSAKWTMLAHEKDINAVAVSPDALMIATGSQDRTLKLWDAQKGTLKVTCKAHKRGIWNVAFSKVDKVVASCSGDMTIRVWDVGTGDCLRLYQGHMGGVLRCKFISGGTQIASSGADGLLKLWTTKTGECVRTYNAHEDRAWGLESIGDGELLVTGGADGCLQMWRDGTEEEKEAEMEKKKMEMEMEQEVQNAARGGKWTVAVRGALKLGMRGKLKAILMEMIEKLGEGRDEGLIRVIRVVKDKTAEEEGEEESWKRIKKLLECCRDWNAAGGARNAGLGGYVLRGMFCIFSPERLMNGIGGEGEELVKGLLAHLERHLQRIRRLEGELAVVECLLEKAEGVGDVGDQVGRNEREKGVVIEKERDVEVEKEKVVVKRKRRRREEVDMEY